MGRFWAFLIGAVGLSLGMGFFGILLGLVGIAYAFIDTAALPSARGLSLLIGGTIFHAIPLSVWTLLRRRLYDSSRITLWGLAVGCWCLIPLSVAIMLFYWQN